MLENNLRTDPPQRYFFVRGLFRGVASPQAPPDTGTSRLTAWRPQRGAPTPRFSGAPHRAPPPQGHPPEPSPGPLRFP